MTEQAKNITLADPEDIADLVNRFSKRLNVHGFGNEQRHELVVNYHANLLMALTPESGHCGYLHIGERSSHGA